MILLSLLYNHVASGPLVSKLIELGHYLLGKLASFFGLGSHSCLGTASFVLLDRHRLVGLLSRRSGRLLLLSGARRCFLVPIRRDVRLILQR